jgi:hypothetical protein
MAEQGRSKADYTRTSAKEARSTILDFAMVEQHELANSGGIALRNRGRAVTGEDVKQEPTQSRAWGENANWSPLLSVRKKPCKTHTQSVNGSAEQIRGVERTIDGQQGELTWQHSSGGGHKRTTQPEERSHLGVVEVLAVSLFLLLSRRGGLRRRVLRPRRRADLARIAV